MLNLSVQLVQLIVNNDCVDSIQCRVNLLLRGRRNESSVME